MGGLKRICKAHGSIIINGVEWVWDYAKDDARLKSEMTKEELAESEKAKWGIIAKNLKDSKPLF